MQYLCKRLDIPDHLLTLFLQRRTTTVPMELVGAAISLNTCYAVPGTEVRYGATRSRACSTASSTSSQV